MRTIPDPGFAGDDGSVPDELSRALTAYDVEPDRLHASTLEVLQRHRLLVPVVAVLGEVGQDERGHAPEKTSHEKTSQEKTSQEKTSQEKTSHEKTSDMATVLMRGRDGRTALLAFTGEDPMRRWDREARPVPVSAVTAAQAAVQDGASAVVVDVAGPVSFVLQGDDLAELAAGRTLVRVDARWGWVD